MDWIKLSILFIVLNSKYIPISSYILLIRSSKRFLITIICNLISSFRNSKFIEKNLSRSRAIKRSSNLNLISVDPIADPNSSKWSRLSCSNLPLPPHRNNYHHLAYQLLMNFDYFHRQTSSIEIEKQKRKKEKKHRPGSSWWT